MVDLVAALDGYGFRLVIHPDFREVPVAGSFVDTPIETVLETAAGQLGAEVDLFQRDGYVYLGPPREGDLSVAVFPVPSGDAAEWAGAFRLSGSQNAEIESFRDYVIFRDTAEGVKRARSFFSAISATRRQYRVEVVFAELTSGDADRLGLDLALDGVLTLNAGLDVDGDLSLSAAIDGLLFGESSSTSGSTWSGVVLHVVEGEPIRIQSGETVGVRRRIATAEGFVLDSGFDEVETGLIVELEARSVASGLVRLDIAPQLSAVSELVDGVPTVATRELQSSAYVGDGGTIVVGGLSQIDRRRIVPRLPGLRTPTGYDDSTSERRFFVFLRLNEMGEPDPVGEERQVEPMPDPRPVQADLVPGPVDDPPDRWGGFGPPPDDWESSWGFNDKDWIDYNNGLWRDKARSNATQGVPDEPG